MIDFKKLVLPFFSGALLFSLNSFHAGEAQAECVTGVRSNDVLNVRSGPGTDYPVIGSLRPNQCGIEVFSYRRGWANINYSNGYVSAKFLQREDEGGDGADSPPFQACVRGVKSNDVLNIRSQASARSRVKGIIPPTACNVEVYSYENSVNGFVRVKYRGVTGWASRKFLYVL